MAQSILRLPGDLIPDTFVVQVGIVRQIADRLLDSPFESLRLAIDFSAIHHVLLSLTDVSKGRARYSRD
jgi:hypothetical protein